MKQQHLALSEHILCGKRYIFHIDTLAFTVFLSLQNSDTNGKLRAHLSHLVVSRSPV